MLLNLDIAFICFFHLVLYFYGATSPDTTYKRHFKDPVAICSTEMRNKYAGFLKGKEGNLNST